MKIKEIIIVEGKYDKIRVDSAVDAVVIETGGFGIFRDVQMRKLIKRYAETKGIIVLTDSDSAGFVIRNHIKNIASKGTVKMAYVPEIKGKEKRKTAAGKEGLLGVEGIDNQIIIDALIKAGCNEEPPKEKITNTDLFNLGYSGKPDSKEKRTKLLKHLNLPVKLSTNALLDALNTFSDLENLKKMTKILDKEI